MGKQKVPRWLLGCGAVGLVVVVAVAVVITTATLGFRDVLGEFEVADASMESVTERFGPIPDYRADPSGAIPADRMELFLTVRERMAAERAKVDRSLALLSNESEVHFAGVRRFGAGVGLLHRLAGFVSARNENLLQAEMGFGEYYYIYTLAYLSWLKKAPDDGPPFEIVGDNGYVMESAFTGTSEADVRGHRTELVRSSLHERLLPILRAQLSELDATGSTAADPAWRAALADEVARLEADPLRVPWQDGLPEVLVDSLVPYAGRLEASYSAMCNALELGLARR